MREDECGCVVCDLERRLSLADRRIEALEAEIANIPMSGERSAKELLKILKRFRYRKTGNSRFTGDPSYNCVECYAAKYDKCAPRCGLGALIRRLEQQ